MRRALLRVPHLKCFKCQNTSQCEALTGCLMSISVASVLWDHPAQTHLWRVLYQAGKFAGRSIEITKINHTSLVKCA